MNTAATGPKRIRPVVTCKHCERRIYRMQGWNGWYDGDGGHLGSGGVCIVAYHHEPKLDDRKSS